MATDKKNKKTLDFPVHLWFNMGNIGNIENICTAFSINTANYFCGGDSKMKVNSPAYVGFKGVLFTCVIAVSCLVSPAYCQGRKITLLVQQTPNEGGAVAPLAGVYRYDPDSEVTLTATPNNGYEFLYWLGDVSDQQSISTVVHLNKPKIVIAVFEPIKGSLNVPNNISGGGGGGGLINNPVTVGQPASLSGGGGGKPQQTKVYAPAGEKNPVVPEPATGVLLALGSLLTFTKRRKRKFTQSQSESRTSLS